MEKTELIQFTEQVANAYAQLAATIDEIGKLKSIVQQITIVSDDLQQAINKVINNQTLTDFKDKNQQVAIKLKSDIEKIDRDLQTILTHRHQFVDFIETYKDMISRFQSQTDEEIKVTNELMKKVQIVTSTIATNQSKLNTNIQKVNTVQNAQEIITHYQTLNQKIETIQDKMNKIEALIQQKLK
jgi:glutamine synthetase type III